MNNYIIPKNKFDFLFNVKLTNEALEPFISFSFTFYINDIYNQLKKLDNKREDADEMLLEQINKIVNPFEFIHTNVPGSTISVSKVKAESNIFFELMELFQQFNLNEHFLTRCKMNIAHLTQNNNSTNYLLNIVREFNDDNIYNQCFEHKKLFELFINNSCQTKFDLLVVEFSNEDYSNTNNYILNMLLTLSIIINNQCKDGVSIIKIDSVIFKPIVDIIFILTSLFDKLYLFKPSISDITKTDRYLICKGFNEKCVNNALLTSIISINKQCSNNCHQNVLSIIDNDIPNHFLYKLEESNIIIGQQQMEAYDQIINMFKNKNREEKMEHMKRAHIQKCIQWCEKNQLPHNKFIDKINIFLTPNKKETTEDIIEVN